MATVKTKRHRNALKAHRQSVKRQRENRGIKVRIHNRVKEFKKLLSHKNYDAASKLLNEIYSFIDKAVKRGIIHWKKAARNKSKLAEDLKKSLSNQ